MVIDMNKHTVKTVSGTDIKDFDGDMFELPPGEYADTDGGGNGIGVTRIIRSVLYLLQNT